MLSKLDKFLAYVFTALAVSYMWVLGIPDSVLTVFFWISGVIGSLLLLVFVINTIAAYLDKQTKNKMLRKRNHLGY